MVNFDNKKSGRTPLSWCLTISQALTITLLCLRFWNTSYQQNQSYDNYSTLSPL